MPQKPISDDSFSELDYFCGCVIWVFLILFAIQLSIFCEKQGVAMIASDQET